jgi:putative Ca2+/H+ antiporter (TMEM165/GDT1 family)
MDLRIVLTTFAAIFLAEMGDKTQLAAITMTASSRKPLSVFLGGALALILVTGLGVLLGTVVTRWIPETIIKKSAAVLFVVIGIWTWFKG